MKLVGETGIELRVPFRASAPNGVTNQPSLLTELLLNVV